MSEANLAAALTARSDAVREANERGGRWTVGKNSLVPVRDQAWERLLAQAPRLAAAADAMRQSLCASALAELEARQFDVVKTGTFAAGGMVLASGRIEYLASLE